MTVLVFLLLSLAGGIGAATRLLLDGLIRTRTKAGFPVGTTVINVTGSLLLGLVAGLTINHALPEQWHMILGTGFLGGYTTFSTASFETVRLVQSRRYLAGFVNGLGMLATAIGAAGLGMWLGGLG